MKRILSLVLAMVMVLGTFSASFAAETTVEKTAIEILNELEVILGDERGLRPNDPLAREEAVVMIARLKGAIEEAQKWETAPTWTDVPNHYKSILGWGQEDKTFEGHSATNFGFGEAMTAKQYAVVLLKILGYSDVTWDKVEEMAKDVMKLENLDAKFTRGSMADMTLVALLTNVKGEEVTLAEELGLEIELPAGEVALALEVKATKANELTVTFNKAVDTENATVVVKRDTSVVTGKPVWNADKTEAVFTTDANMIKGTYTVEVTVKVEGSDDIVVTGSADVLARFVKQIVVLNSVALTGESAPNARDYAYVYYDVLDQYDESVRNTTNITWTSSVGGDVTSKANRTTGEIRLERTNQQFVFGEKIFISGVDTKTGMSVQKELTVGQPRALDQIEIKGFVKKGTSTISKELPAGFKADTYYMVFTGLDQNGNAYATDIEETDLTFVSDNPLLILKAEHDGLSGNIKTLVIDGVQYGAVFLQPGMNVDRGGEANIMAISSKTGKQTTLNVIVGNFTILTQFDLLQPSGVTAEGEIIEIPFQALDQNGNAITNFAVLARQSSLNALSFNSGGQGNLVLSENNDGTATLEFRQGTVAWNTQNSTNGIGRPVSLTSIVTGGNASTLMLTITDKARPEAISAVKMDKVVVEQGQIKLNLSDTTANSFTFFDQYGRVMSRKNANAFFAASNTFVAGNDFMNHTYAVRATYKGDSNVFNGAVNDRTYQINSGTTVTLTAEHGATSGITTAKSGMVMQFDIVRYHTGNSTFANAISVSPKKSEAVTVVDITAVKDFVVKELSKLFVETTNSNNATGVEATLGNDVNATGATIPSKKAVVVTGTYNGQTVSIPSVYYGLTSNGLTFTTDNKVDGIQPYVIGSPYVAPVKQVVTATVPSANTVTGAGIYVVVVADGAINKTKNVDLVVGDTANDIAAKVVATLNADTDITNLYTVKGVNNAITLTRNVAAANNPALNVSLGATGTTATGVTPVPTSVNTTAGVAEVLLNPQKGFMWKNFYDETTARLLRKDASSNVRAEIKNLDITGTPVVDTANRTVVLSDAAPIATTIAGPVELTVNPTNTVITVADIEDAAEDYVVKDQYGEDYAATKHYRASEVVELEDAYASRNFKISSNDTATLKIEGAERGDTFTLIIRAEGAQTTVKITVGADAEANIDGSSNNYLNTLVPVLEAQRINSLQ